jgi:hypothetical protein
VPGSRDLVHLADESGFEDGRPPGRKTLLPEALNEHAHLGLVFNHVWGMRAIPGRHQAIGLLEAAVTREVDREIA